MRRGCGATAAPSTTEERDHERQPDHHTRPRPHPRDRIVDRRRPTIGSSQRLQAGAILGFRAGAQVQGDHRDTLARVTRVLIVDDDPAGGRVLATILRGEGLRAHVIDDAELALEMLRLLRFDLLLVDMALPGMSGPDLVRVLRRAGVQTPAILVSGAPPDDLAAEAAACGANAWLPKPLDRVTLLEAIEEVIIRRSSLPPVV